MDDEPQSTIAVSQPAGKQQDSNEQQPWDIRRRSVAYALRAIKLFRFLPTRKDAAGWILAKQYLPCATSIGANIEEAQAGESRADFIHKLGIAQKAR